MIGHVVLAANWTEGLCGQELVPADPVVYTLEKADCGRCLQLVAVAIFVGQWPVLTPIQRGLAE